MQLLVDTFCCILYIVQVHLLFSVPVVVVSVIEIAFFEISQHA